MFFQISEKFDLDLPNPEVVTRGEVPTEWDNVIEEERSDNMLISSLAPAPLRRHSLEPGRRSALYRPPVVLPQSELWQILEFGEIFCFYFFRIRKN